MQPERNIEKLLRAFGKKRREQMKDSFTLHPANRRLLQAEIQQRISQNRRMPRPAGWWIRRATYAVGAFAVALALAMIVPEFQPTREKDEAGRSFDLASAPNRSLESDVQQVHQRPASGEDRAPSLDADGGGSGGPTFGVAMDNERRPEPLEKSKRELLEPLQMAAHPQSATVFRQVAATQNGRAVPLLLRFAIEPTAAGVRVVDADGSVYEPIQSERTKTLPNQSKVAAMAETPSRQESESVETFAVLGTNLTLKQSVFFEGTLNYLTNTGSAGFANGNGTIVSTYLRGTVRLDGAIFEIEAQPITPEAGNKSPSQGE